MNLHLNTEKRKHATRTRNKIKTVKRLGLLAAAVSAIALFAAIRSSGTLPLIALTVSALCLLCTFFSLGQVKKMKAEIARLINGETIDEFFITGKLESISELTTQMLTYSGMIRVSDGKIPLLTQKGFMMTYTARIRAGVDLSQAVVDCADTTVNITLPKATILQTTVLPESIKFYDERIALLNPGRNEDVTKALILAEKDVQKKGDVTELLKQADMNAALLIINFLKDAVDGRKIEINMMEPAEQAV
ncbi:MAG: DUF4230 domain-containing protein [Oscillospiraceae bacterium]|nr:DUF4230 domain-containing protein [Oscillospiraceae bacterium]